MRGIENPSASITFSVSFLARRIIATIAIIVESATTRKILSYQPVSFDYSNYCFNA